jgi:uncharacterized protein (TIGR04255 family)
MAKYKHLNNAPIREAVVDIRVEPIKAIGEDTLHQIKQIIRDKYPDYDPIRAFQGTIGVLEGKPITEPMTEIGIIGYKFKSTDNTEVVQFKKDGFTFSRLYPYTSWIEVQTEAERLWSIYLDKHGANRVIRLAVRYINQLKIKLPISDFKEYITTPPEIPEGIPNEVSSFISRVVLHDTQTDIRAIIAQSMEAETAPGNANITLDNDVFKLVELKPEQTEIWEIFTQLVRLKNDIFFGSITEKTVRIYE